MSSEARQKKIMEKLNRAQKCSILGPQNLGSRGGLGPRAPPGPRLVSQHTWTDIFIVSQRDGQGRILVAAKSSTMEKYYFEEKEQG